MKAYFFLIFLLAPSILFAAKNSWKVVIYMQADNNLASYAFWDLAEIQQNISDQIPVLVHLDLPDKENLYHLKVQRDEKEIVFSKEEFDKWSIENIQQHIVKKIPETNDQNQQESLLSFLIESEKEYPTENTLLVFWGHGEGYSFDQNSAFGGIALDENPKSKLTISEINDVISAYNKESNKELNIVAFDACLMQTLEVMSEFNSEVKFIVGSTQIQDYRGLPYDQILSYMNHALALDSSDSDSSEDYYLAKKLPELFDISAKEQLMYQKSTMSVVALSQLHNDFLHEFDLLMKVINVELSANFEKLLAIQFKLAQLPRFLGESIDIKFLLAQFEDIFSENPVVFYQLLKAEDALDRMILNYYYGASYFENQNYFLGQFRALGIWLPSGQYVFESRINDFKNSSFYEKVNNWNLFLELIF